MPTIVDLKSIGEFKELRVGVRQDEIRHRESLSAEAWIGALGEQVDTKLGRIPEFALDSNLAIIAKNARIIDRGVPGAGCFNAGNKLLAEIFVDDRAGIVRERSRWMALGLVDRRS